MIQNLIEKSSKIVALTGAGVSADSGIPDFKTTDELWEHEVSRAEANSIWFFKDEPRRFWELYRDTFALDTTFEPNGFHYFLAGLEHNHDITIATQNVDGLHTAAGSSDVIEFHGSTQRLVCIQRRCRKQAPGGLYRKYRYVDFAHKTMPQCPACGGVLKPDVSLFGEGVSGFGAARDLVIEADLLIVAGTSLRVGPFNELPIFAQVYNPGAAQVWINNEDTPPEEYDFTEIFSGGIADFTAKHGTL